MRTHLSLIRRAASSAEHNVWDEFLNFYEPFINAILRKMGFREPDIDDVRQLVFLKLWERLGSYRKQTEKSKFRSWLAVVIRNVAIDWLRGQKNRDLKRGTDERSVEERTISDPEITAMIEKEWQRYVVAKAMERIKPVFSNTAFEVLRLSLEGMGAEEIAETLSIRAESVYVLKSRVKTRVQQEIAQIRFEQESRYGEN